MSLVVGKPVDCLNMHSWKNVQNQTKVTAEWMPMKSADPSSGDINRKRLIIRIKIKKPQLNQDHDHEPVPMVHESKTVDDQTKLLKNAVCEPPKKKQKSIHGQIQKKMGQVESSMDDRELVEMVATAKRAADMVAMRRLPTTNPEFSRALNALSALKNSSVSYDSLKSTEVVKSIELLTKHPNVKIRTEAANVLQAWKKSSGPQEPSKMPLTKKLEVGDQKTAITRILKASDLAGTKVKKAEKETPKQSCSMREKIRGQLMPLTKKLEVGDQKTAITRIPKAFDLAGTKVKKAEKETPKQSSNMREKIRGQLMPPTKKLEVGDQKTAITRIPKAFDLAGTKVKMAEKETPKQSSNMREKIRGQLMPPTKKLEVGDQKKAITRIPKAFNLAETQVKKEEKETPKPSCNMREKIRGQLVEALSKVLSEAIDSTTKAKAKACDLLEVAASTESTMHKKMGQTQRDMAKYRSILFNLKDPNNPELRRRVLLGEIAPENLVKMTVEEMASSKRKRENEGIRLKGLIRCKAIKEEEEGTTE